MSAMILGVQNSCGGSAGGCGAGGRTCTGGERPDFWLVSGIWLVSDDEPPAGTRIG